MKKFIFVFLILILFTACEKIEGDYIKGTYFGAHEFEFRGDSFVTTAVVYVDDSGVLKSVFIDTTYVKDEVLTTKKTLGEDYGMRETSANKGVIEGGSEWYEQLKVFENKILEEQGLDWVVFSNEEETEIDSLAGVTITVDTYYSAVKQALEQAKK